MTILAWRSGLPRWSKASATRAEDPIGAGDRRFGLILQATIMCNVSTELECRDVLVAEDDVTARWDEAGHGIAERGAARPIWPDDNTSPGATFIAAREGVRRTITASPASS